MIISIVLWLVAAGCVLLWLARAVSTGAPAARGRGVLIRSGVDAVVLLALVRALAPPPGVWSWLWLVATVAVGVGLAAAVHRWPQLPWRTPSARRGAAGGSDRSAVVGSIVYAVAGVALVGVLA